MHSRCIAHRSGRGLDKSRIQAYRWRRVYRRATGGCDGSTAGHWASSNPAFTISRRRCGTKPYTSSGSSRFPTMLLSLPPFGLRSGGRLEVICPELRPSRMAIHSMRRMAHSFPACRSSRLTCRNAGRSEDPKAPALDCPLGLFPVGLAPGSVRRATVVRCRWWPDRSDRVSHRLSFFSSDSTRGKSAPFQVGSLHPRRVALSL
jgi:hypothetical protein